jgi:hypothetical protein
LWKLAVLSRTRSSVPAASEVAVVAPGQRGWVAIAIKPPGRRRACSCRSRATGSGQNPSELTAITRSNGWSKWGRCSAEPHADVEHACSHRGPVTSSGASDHQLRVVDSAHVAGVGDASVLAESDAWAGADLEDAVGRFELEERYDPWVPLDVRRAVPHHPGGQQADETPGVAALGDEIANET